MTRLLVVSIFAIGLLEAQFADLNAPGKGADLYYSLGLDLVVSDRGDRAPAGPILLELRRGHDSGHPVAC